MGSVRLRALPRSALSRRPSVIAAHRHTRTPSQASVAASLACHLAAAIQSSVVLHYPSSPPSSTPSGHASCPADPYLVPASAATGQVTCSAQLRPWTFSAADAKLATNNYCQLLVQPSQNLEARSTVDHAKMSQDASCALHGLLYRSSCNSSESLFSWRWHLPMLESNQDEGQLSALSGLASMMKEVARLHVFSLRLGARRWKRKRRRKIPSQPAARAGSTRARQY